MITLPAEPLTITVIVLTAAFLVFGVFLFDLRKKWGRLFGAEAPPDAASLKNLIDRLSASEQTLHAVLNQASVLEQIARSSIQKVGFLRFNPFRDTGSDQSFSLALLDHKNNGVVITSLYAREGTRVYAKEINDGKPKQQLSGEERRVLEQAINKDKK